MFNTTSSMTIDGPPGRLLPLLVADGERQMALDTLLLEQASTAPILRFYRWKGAWLSLGRHQRQWPSHWTAMASSGSLSLVRRPSGGQAVLHAGGLTYALIWPKAPRQRKLAYREACGWLIDGFRMLGEELRFGDAPASADNMNCFARSTVADLVDSHGCKRIGSAQRWLHGCLLQHGEILLDPPTDLWTEVFGGVAPSAAPASIPRIGLDQILLQALQHQWPECQWSEPPLSDRERQLLGLTNSDSDDCMVSTTCGSITSPRG